MKYHGNKFELNQKLEVSITTLSHSQTLKVKKVKVKLYVYSPDIPECSADFAFIIPMYWNSHLQSHLLGKNAAQFYAVEAIHIVSISIPLGIHFCWVGCGSVDSKLA